MTVRSRLPRRLRRTIARLETQSEVLRGLAAAPPEVLLERSEKVSGWAVAQQVEHLAATGDAVLDGVGALLAAPRQPPGGRPTPPGWVLLVTGWIPRGRVRTRPEWSPEEASPETAARRIGAFLDRLDAILARGGDIATASGSRPHFLLGHFTASRWLYFLAAHQRHHLDLIRDIRRAAGGEG